MHELLKTLGATLGVVLAVAACLGLAWRWVVLPNLREQLFKPVEETRRQVSDNRHVSHPPTIKDRLDDVEMSLEAVGANQRAILKRLGDHIGESTNDRAHLWLIIEALVHDQTPTERKHRYDKPGNPGGA